MEIVLNGDRFYFFKAGESIVTDTQLDQIKRKAKEYKSYGRTIKICKVIQSKYDFGIVRVLTEAELK